MLRARGEMHMETNQRSIVSRFASVVGLSLLAAGCTGGASPPSPGVDRQELLQPGGFVIITGDDSDDDSHGAGTAYGGLFRNLFAKALAESKTGGTGILNIGSNPGAARDSFNSWVPVGTPVTFTHGLRGPCPPTLPASSSSSSPACSSTPTAA